MIAMSRKYEAAALAAALGLAVLAAAPGAAQGPQSPASGAFPSAAEPGGAPESPAVTSSTTLVAIDRPVAGAVVPLRFTVRGWAVDPEAPGSGVDAVHVYLDGEAGQGYFLGAATYGEEREDVADQLGQPRFALSGYTLQVEVPPGPHTLYVYGRRRGAGEPRAWSAPATVEIVAQAEDATPAASRIVVPPGGCARGPDGACINRMSMPAPTCAQVGPEGQCLPAGPGMPPGVVGLPASPGPAPANAGFCTQVDSANRCLAYSAAPTTGATTLTLRAELNGGMVVLSWTAVSGAMTYEVLRCGSASGQHCASVAVVSATSFPVARTPNAWYRVEARTQTGQVVATSNFVGPL